MNHSTVLFAKALALESRVINVEAVAALATPDPVDSPVIAGVVIAGDVIV